MYKTPKSCKSETPVENLLNTRNLSSVRKHLFCKKSLKENSKDEEVDAESKRNIEFSKIDMFDITG